MPQPIRVFISSVVGGMEEYRDAAEEAIRSRGGVAVRSEKLAGDGTAPRTACLDAVISCDVLVLLLGAKYGFVAPSGVSATEEEYQEATKHGRLVLVFVEDANDVEPLQQAFIGRVSDYVTGRWRRQFTGAPELRSLLAEVLTEIDVTPTDSARTNQLVSDLLAAPIPEPFRRSDECVLVMAWVSARNEEAIDPVRLGSAPFIKQLNHLAHAGEPSVFAYEQATSNKKSASSLLLLHGEAMGRRRTDFASIELQASGALRLAMNVTGGSAGDRWPATYHLDPKAIVDRATAAWAFALAAWNEIDPHGRHDAIAYNGALWSVGNRKYEPVPPSQNQGVTVPPSCSDNPLIIYAAPKSISRGVNTDVAERVQHMSAMISGRFDEWKDRHF